MMKKHTPNGFVDATKEEEQETLDIIYNMAYRNEPYVYHRLIAQEKLHTMVNVLPQVKKGDFDTNTRDAFITESSITFYQKDFFDTLGVGKIINLSNELSFMLDNTEPTNNIDLLRNPYPAFLLNEKVQMGRFFANGVLVINQKNFYKIIGEGENRWFPTFLKRMTTNESLIDINIMCMYIFDDVTKESFYYMLPLNSEKLKDNFQMKDEFVKDFDYDAMQNKTVKKLQAHMVTRVINLLTMFKNRPNALYEREKIVPKSRNEKRMKKGKALFSNTTTLNLTQELHQYAGWLKETKKECPYAILVRGFYRHYTNERYVNKKGDIDFIEPFIKGADKPLPDKFKQFVKAR